jgi:hypothetical protein
MLLDLQQGAPGLAIALARALSVCEEPEVDVRRDPIQDGSARWVVVIHSASSHVEIDLDPDVRAAIGPAIVLHLFSLIDGLRRDYPEVLRDVDLAGMLAELLVKARERSS